MATTSQRSHTFRVWIPDAPAVHLAIYDANPTGPASPHKKIPMQKAEDLVHRPDRYGWWEATVENVGHGTFYGFIVEKNKYGVEVPLPDPRTPSLPLGVHGPSKIIDHDVFKWSDQNWRGLPLAGYV